MIKFKVAAKTDVGLIRTNNEDNFQISWDLSALPMRWINNEIHQMGDKGCLLIVADGMGGANAGEVASQIAIDTIKNTFLPENLTEKVLMSKDSINSFIKNAIIHADKNIKEYSKSHSETNGMGTTIVLAWIINDKMYIGWCGDSRAYVYNPVYGLQRVSKDHSYVQQLVDSGKLSEEEAFDFPDSNIITQCLSASPQKCHPETLSTPYTLSNGDTVLLCTDGLCGMIRDTEIESILAKSDDDVNKTAEQLISAALNASGADNVTLCLFHALSGLKPAIPIKKTTDKPNKSLYWIIGIVVVVILGVIAWFLFGKSNTETVVEPESKAVVTDSISVSQTDSVQTKQSAEPVLQNANSNDEVREPKDGDNRNVGNGKKLLDGINTGKLPKTEESTTPDPTSEPEGEILATSDIIVVTIPENVVLARFLKNYGMNINDFKKLNPGLDFNKLEKGDKIKVYKKK